MIELSLHQANTQRKEHKRHRDLTEQRGRGHHIFRQRDMQIGHQQTCQRGPQYRAAQPQPAGGIGREDKHADREVQQIGEHKEDHDGPQLLLAKRQHHQGDTEIAGISEHGGQDQGCPLNLFEFEQCEQQTG